MNTTCCFLCKLPLNSRTQKIDLNSSKTCHTNTNLLNFINTLCGKMITSCNNFICLICLDVINDLDYAEVKCRQLKEKLLKYLDYFEETKESIVAVETKKHCEIENVFKEQLNKSEEGYKENTNTILSASDSCKTNESLKDAFKNKRGRKKHVQTTKTYKCEECGKNWKSMSELKVHTLSHNKNRPFFICEICGQAYKHKTALDVHIGMHNGINPFTCVYCNKSFTQKGALQRHMPIHTGECPYQCDLCGKRFVHHTSFNIHLLTHSGLKNYKCNVCGTALMSASHLKRHMRAHTGEKNFQCSTCGKKFAERYNLISHQKLHENSTSKKRLRCTLCEMNFDCTFKMNNHIRIEHKDFVQNIL